ncbi:DUF6338 family protein [Mesorhizobium sp. M0488]|uniref:DUF6338 family protein n=1 Tax=unclassified Mesorhizobium TaxID=325217 RepID=UPI0033350D50
MTPSLFFIQLAILLLPGVLWARIDSAYGSKRDQSQFEFGIRAVLFGLTSYAATYMLFLLLNAPFEMIDLANAADKNVLTRGMVTQTLWAILIGFSASIIWLYAVNYKILTRILQGVRATKRYGDEDVWEFTFNSDSADVQFVHIRDFANRVVYSGWVSVFSETEKLRELVLSEVDIYDFEGNLISSPPRLYIARAPEGLHIEFPIQPMRPEAIADVT